MISNIKPDRLEIHLYPTVKEKNERPCPPRQGLLCKSFC